MSSNYYSEQFAYLTTTGRKSGLPREIEIWFVEREGRIYMLTEQGYRAHWVRNILANPCVRIRVGKQQWTATGRVLDPRTDADLYNAVRALSHEKYGWGDGLPVEFSLQR
jgi:deazaflavin-dependent oxidoreductase (nitroreductase family)